MKVLVSRRQAPAAPALITNPARGPRVLAVAGASGGAGASTLCALLAGASAEVTALTGHRIAVLDGGEGPASPWPDWLSPGADEALGEEGMEALDVMPPARAYPRSLLLRCAGSIRGLAGVSVLTGSELLDERRELAPLSRAFAIAVQDLAIAPDWVDDRAVRSASGGLVLAIGGTADGVAAGIRAVRLWASYGLSPSLIRPVVIAGSVGGLSPRARARLALLDANTQPAVVVPFDPAIARRGLAEALACGAVGAPTRLAVRRIASDLLASTPDDDARPSDGLALFQVRADSLLAQSRTSTTHEGTTR